MDEKALFKITVEDAQFSAKHRIGRELKDDELIQIESYLNYAFEDWRNILQSAVLKITNAKELSKT